ncbi:MAG: peptide chain release factor N(5)-glutamine methyltransferase [Sulfuriferula sp.]|nr:peptide chain release factor N(5)-glutamine methyltransferase [Sulfuriferula sp.]
MQIRALLQADAAHLATVLALPITEARFEVQLLLAHVMQVSRAWLIAYDDSELSAENMASYQLLFQRRLLAEPIAYIFGEKEFYGMCFTVTPDVLIPRPDTELLVESALARIPTDSPARILDLGTGSGAIAISIAQSRPLSHVIAVDKSAAALTVALANAVKLGVINVTFIASDWFLAIPTSEQFDVIVSNPPYIAEHDAHLQQLQHEPISALTAGITGLDDLQKIIKHAPQYLAQNGYLLLEHGYNQAAIVREYLAQAGYADIHSEQDLSNVARVSWGRKV